MHSPICVCDYPVYTPNVCVCVYVAWCVTQPKASRRNRTPFFPLVGSVGLVLHLHENFFFFFDVPLLRVHMHMQ